MYTEANTQASLDGVGSGGEEATVDGEAPPPQHPAKHPHTRHPLTPQGSRARATTDSCPPRHSCVPLVCRQRSTGHSDLPPSSTHDPNRIHREENRTHSCNHADTAVGDGGSAHTPLMAPRVASMRKRYKDVTAQGEADDRKQLTKDIGQR